MGFEPSIRVFLWAVVVGMGLIVGAGAIRLIVGFVAKAVSVELPW